MRERRQAEAEVGAWEDAAEQKSRGALVRDHWAAWAAGSESGDAAASRKSRGIGSWELGQGSVVVVGWGGGDKAGLTVSKVERLVHVGLQVGGRRVLGGSFRKGGHVAVKVEELRVGEHGQVIVESAEFLLGGQVGGRGDRVQVGDVLRHVGCATGIVRRHGGRAGGRRTAALVNVAEHRRVSAEEQTCG